MTAIVYSGMRPPRNGQSAAPHFAAFAGVKSVDAPGPARIVRTRPETFGRRVPLWRNW